MKNYQFFGIITILLVINSNVADSGVSSFASYILALVFSFLAVSAFVNETDKS